MRRRPLIFRYSLFIIDKRIIKMYNTIDKGVLPSAAEIIPSE